MIKGREVFRDNLRHNPTNALAARDEIAASGRIAATYHMMGEYEKAIAIQQEVAKGFDDLLRKNPTSNESARDAANTYSTMGLTLAKAGRLEEAVQALRRSEQLHQERCVRFPQDVRGPRDLAVTMDQLAEVSVRQKNWGKAVEQLRKAIGLRAAGLQKDANDQRLLWRQAKSYGRLGNALLETGEKGSARTAFEQARKAIEDLNTKSKLSSEDAKSLAEVTRQLASLR